LGLWDLPKGKVDEGEAVDAAALREVREECGLVRVELIQRLCETWHTYERNGEQHLKRTDWYWMLSNSAERLIAQHEEDISEVRWMDLAGVDELKRGTYPSLLEVIAAWERAVHRPA
jgi:ADP-ribose pyrophosphatase YjhB (NUDIX family)